MIKSSIRKYVYPIYNHVCDILIRASLPVDKYKPSIWLWGQRGNDYERHRSRINKYKMINGSIVLVAGCGSGRDLYSWLKYNPKKIIGVDIFEYPEEWSKFTTYCLKNTKTTVEFYQIPLEQLDSIPLDPVDIVSSDAVLEHIVNLKEVLERIKGVMKSDGVFYSTYGPLWYSYGGDHISGNDNHKHGYNHLILKKEEYSKYLESFGPYKHNEDDGRTWIYNDLFSRLLPSQYYDLFSKVGFNILFDQLMIDPRATKYLKSNPDLPTVTGVSYCDLSISAMSVICQKK